ncbi:hypothetical protein [Pseudomonas sp. Z1-12]
MAELTIFCSLRTIASTLTQALTADLDGQTQTNHKNFKNGYTL